MPSYSGILLMLVSLAFTKVRSQPAITCGYDRIGETMHVGYLGIFSNDQVAAPLPVEGVNVSMQSEYGLGFLYIGGTATPEEYIFQQCNSAFMGYPMQATDGNTTISYGQIMPLDGEPFTVNYTVGGLDLIRHGWRSFSDDQSQLLQYWSLTNGSDGLLVDFLGVTANGTSYDDGPEMVFRLGLGPVPIDGVTPITVQAFTPEEAPPVLYHFAFFD